MVTSPTRRSPAVYSGVIDVTDLKPSEEAMHARSFLAVSKFTIPPHDSAKPPEEEEQVSFADALFNQVGLSGSNLAKAR